MKFNSLTTKKPTPTYINTNKKDKQKFVPNVPFSLSAKLSEKYEGTADNILGAINGLPPAIRTFFKDAELTGTKMNHQDTAYRLKDSIDNIYYLNIQEKNVGGIPMFLIRIKMNGKFVFRDYIKRR